MTHRHRPYSPWAQNGRLLPWRPWLGSRAPAIHAPIRERITRLFGPGRGDDTSAIDDKYAALGGSGGFLGRPFDAGAGSQEMDTADGRGRCRDFEHGSIYWSAATGAHEVHGDIRVKWARVGGARGFLGFPTTDETGTPDGRGRYNHFQGGSIYWTLETRAHEVHGAIRDKWASMGWERSRLRYPISDELVEAGGIGRYSQFQGGSIHWAPGRPVEVRYRID